MRPLGLVRLAALRVRRRWNLALAQWLGMATAVALTSVFPLVASVADEVGLHSFLGQLGFKRYVTVEQRVTASLAAYTDFQSAAGREVGRQAGKVLRPGARYASTFQLVGRSLNGVPLQPDPFALRPALASYEAMPQHADLVTGGWSGTVPLDGAYYAAVSEQAAALVGLSPGDRYCVAGSTSAGQPQVCVIVSGIWRARAADMEFWGVSVPTSALMLDRAAFYSAVARVSGATGAVPSFGAPPPVNWMPRAGAVFTPDLAGIHTGNARALVQRLGALRTFFGVRRDGSLSTAGLLAAWAIASVMAPIALGGRLPALDQLDLGSLVPALAATLPATLAVVAVQAFRASRGGLLEARRSLSRPEGQPWWRWRNFDLAAAALAVPILAEARLLGGAQVRLLAETGAADLTSLVLPAVALALLAVGCLRLLGLTGRGLRLHLEQGVLLAYAILVGSALGLVLAWAILPSLEVGTDLTETVPPTVFTVNPGSS